MAPNLQCPIILSFGIDLHNKEIMCTIGSEYSKITTATMSLLCLVQVHTEIASETSIESTRVSLGTTAVAKCTLSCI